MFKALRNQAFRRTLNRSCLTNDIFLARIPLSEKLANEVTNFEPRLPHLFSSSFPTPFSSSSLHATTVLCVRKENKVVLMADGQVTLGSVILKPNVKKLRRLGENGNVIAGFAGATADALTLFDRLETKIEEHPGQLLRASVELAKLWRTDKFLRKLDAVMIVADSLTSLTLTGNGDVIESHDGLIGIGSGGSYALSAAKALIDIEEMDAEMIARKAMKIAADTCIYTNHNFTMEVIQTE